MVSSTALVTVLLLPLLLTLSNAATFNIVNQCTYTVWAAAVPGGGKQLNSGESWTISANPGTTSARIWARTGCNFDGSGHGSCQTGDCGGLLVCQAYGTAPNTLAEYSLDQYMNQDFYDISNVAGFNVPMDFKATSGNCHDIRCSADVVGQCPPQLQTNGGCNDPCTVFKTDEYCCNSGSCQPTDFSRYFKNLCPDAYSYPKDDATSLFTCPSGANYQPRRKLSMKRTNFSTTNKVEQLFPCNMAIIGARFTIVWVKSNHRQLRERYAVNKNHGKHIKDLLMGFD